VSHGNGKTKLCEQWLVRKRAVSEPDAASRATTFRIHGDHAALPGHFPGRPIVPGVILLDVVLERAQQQFGSNLRVAGIEQAKFLAPLLPDQDAQLTLARIGSRLQFTVRHDSLLIAQGSFTLTDVRT
jgi:3-hydroxymyristoyl/3-hydroxydecanoyl-(acyl carrier protein) dehydratase